MSLTGFFIMVAIYAATPILLPLAVYFVLRSRRRSFLNGTVRPCVEAHGEALGRRRRQLVTTDPYGKEDVRLWQREIGRFIEAALLPDVQARSGRKVVLTAHRAALMTMIDEVARTASSRAAETPFVRVPTTKAIGDEYEIRCADLLTKAGWAVRRTGGSGDQGCDIVAQRESIRVVLQCKCYSGAVGNSAVQEVAAARDYEEADYGAVVTNSRYTGAAERLAQKTGILLLHQDDLTSLDRLIANSER